MSKYIDPRFSALKEYTPGEQPQDKKYIKLNTNESPYPPSEGVIAAISRDEVARLKLYSDPESKKLKQTIAKAYGMPEECVFVSNGSDEILNFAFMLYGRAKGAIFPDITYGFYKVFGQLYGIDYDEIPLTDSFKINPEDYMATGKFTVIANPNAPTGMTMECSDIEAIISSNPDNIVLIDEAYIDFGGESCYKLTNKYKNLIVCQTFSKSRSLAGARLGFCFADKEIIADLEKIKFSTNPYNINRLTQLAGVASVEDWDYFAANCKRIIDSREKVSSALKLLGFEVLPSKANFLFVRHPKLSGEEIYMRLRERGILVRHFTAERICDFNRITIGSEEETDALIRELNEIIKGVIL